MKNIINVIKDIVLITAIVILAFSYYKEKKYRYAEPEIITICDTTRMTVIDTVFVPVERIKYIDSVIVREIEIKADTTLILQQKVYEDTLSKIWISGIQPEIDSIRYYIPRDTTFVYKEITKIEKKKNDFWTNRFVITAGVTGGYGLIHKQFDVVAGIGVAVRLY